jgi:epsilon-lactone hydrolase
MDMIFIPLLIIIAGLIGLYFWLRGQQIHGRESLPDAHIKRFPGAHPSHASHAGIHDLMAKTAPMIALPMRQQLPALRKFMDELGLRRPLAAQITAVEVNGIRGEWVVSAGADPTRRTLYIHGGAFTMGSPISHRPITEHFSRLTGGAVFAVDYRLMPENRRGQGIDDCRAAYRWLLDNGPDGVTPLSALVVAGDSAGGNLTLTTIAWARDQGLRAANAAIALSPLTDATFGSASLLTNIDTDTMLGPMFGKIARAPAFLHPFIAWFMSQRRPCDPSISPLMGPLNNLPPTLVQASSTEMLHDDALRYVAKAVASGSPARLQTWEHMPHVWQMFDEYLDEANQALDEIGGYLVEHVPGVPPVVPRRCAANAPNAAPNAANVAH